MEASQELALFRNFDFEIASSAANEVSGNTRLNIAKRESTKTVKNRKKKAQRNAVAQNTQLQLDANELLFFPEHLNVQPRDTVPPTDEEKHREKMYKEKIAKMTDTDRRQFRAQRDIRYLHKSKNEPKTTESPNADSPCLHHVAGKCEHNVCIYNHQMRLPRQFGVCRFYLKNACTKGNACTHMHSEFPCKFYYLGMPHPKNIDADNCRFTHGDVLNENTKRFFLKQIEHWVKEKTMGNTDDCERQMNEMMARFEEQEQKMLSERHRKQETVESKESNAVATTTTLTGDMFALREVLNEAQIRRLTADNITSVHQLRQMSVTELESYHLTMDQIYEIKSKRFKPDHESPDDESEKPVAASNQDAEVDNNESKDRQNDGNGGKDDETADGTGDKGETESPNRIPVVEKQIENESDDSDSDNEDRLVINDELL